MPADPAYQPTLVWDDDSLVWDDRTLVWDQFVPPPEFFTADTLTVMEDRGKHLTVLGGIRRRIT